ncbi:MAG: aminopeptidase [Acetobacteraceae bacterium]|nr:aminopeptidase [Acetobacteraceae bacterium]
MLRVSSDSIARRIVRTCMRVRPGEVIMLSGGVHNFELVEDLAVNIRRAGAFPVITVTSDRLTHRLVSELDVNTLREVPSYLLRWLDEVNGIIDVDGSRDPRCLQDLPEDRVSACRAGLEAIHRKRAERSIRWLWIGYPTREKAQLYGIDFEKLHDGFWRALDVDYEAMAAAGSALVEAIGTGRAVRVRSDQGTDLEFTLLGRTARVDDGVISDEDLAQGFVTNNLPCGEVFYAPVESSVNGRAVFDLAYYRGHPIRGIDVTFSEGRLVRARAAENETLFLDRLRNATGGADRVGEFGIGLNPSLRAPTGDTSIDEKIWGSVHLALGDNLSFGGQNSSNLHWDLLIMRPTVEVDGRLLIKDGELLPLSPPRLRHRRRAGAGAR